MQRAPAIGIIISPANEVGNLVPEDIVSKSPNVTVEIRSFAALGSPTLEEECAVLRGALAGGSVVVEVAKNFMTTPPGFEPASSGWEDVVYLLVSTPRTQAGRSEFARAGMAYEELRGGPIKSYDRKEARLAWEREWDGFAAL